MKVGITTFGGDGGKSGISQYIIQMLRQFADFQREFAGAKGSVSFEVLVHEDERDIFAPAELGLNVLPFPASLRSTPKNLLWHQTGLPGICRKRGYDVLFLPAGNRRLPWSCPCPTVGAVFDFSILHVPGKYDALHTTYITRVLPALARRLTRVVTLSENARADIVGFARVPSSRVHVIPAGVDTSIYFPQPAAEAHARVTARYSDRGMRPGVPYLLYISRIEHPGKNHVRLIQAFDALKAAGTIPHQLVLAGSDWLGSDEVHRAARESRYAADIVFTGFAPTAEIPDLYAGADLFVFPSLYEGFGLPLLEAMACGIPVACANTSSLPEVAGDAAVLFDPMDNGAMARIIGDLLSNPAQRQVLARRGRERVRRYSWRKAAMETLDVLRDAAREGKTRR